MPTKKKKRIIMQLTNSACTHLDTHMVVNTGVIPPKKIRTTTYCLPSLRASLKPRFRSSETKQNWLYNLYCSSASYSTPHIFDKVHLICLQDSTWYLWQGVFHLSTRHHIQSLAKSFRCKLSTHTKNHIHKLKIIHPCHCQSLVDCGNTKITKHAL